MARFLLSRLAISCLVLIVVSMLSFGLFHLTGDAALAFAGEDTTEAEMALIRERLGLGKPIYLQYLVSVEKLLKGDFGISLFTQEPVIGLLISKLAVTVKLAAISICIAVAIAIPLGVISAYSYNSWVDWLVTFSVTIGQAIPSFWLALMLSTFFGLYLGWLPVAGDGSLRHFVLPSVTLGIAMVPALTWVTKTGMLDVLDASYILFARAKGLSSARIALFHALPNAILPVISLLSVQLGQLLAGSVVIETVFSINGIGRLALVSIQRADLPIIQSVVLCLACIYLVLTLLADLVNRYIDPRLRNQ